MNNGHIIAKRYALAFLNVYPLAPEFLDSIKSAIHFLDQHDEVFLMLKIPLLDDAKKSQALEDYLIGRFKLPDSFKKLIALLIAQKRSHKINNVLVWIVELYEEQAGIEFFEVSSSALLNDADIEVIKQFLANKTKHTIITKQEQDEKLIAGVRLRSMQHLWEYSIRKQLAAVQSSLRQGFGGQAHKEFDPKLKK